MGHAQSIGILGAGQLAQMTCEAARNLGIETHVYASDLLEPAALVADRVWVGDLSDRAKLREFAHAAQVVTYDTELLPIDSVRHVAEYADAYPRPPLLWYAQNRVRERDFLLESGVPIPKVYPVRDAKDLREGLSIVGLPAVLKTSELGYDGKGQARIESMDDAMAAWGTLGRAQAVLEEWIAYKGEMSVIVAGGLDGEKRCFPAIDNRHKGGVLHLSTAPSALPKAAIKQAEDVALRLADASGLVGLLTVEMFYTDDGRVLVNELAPRPHNSGHHTQLSARVSQFEQLVRAISGMPLGDTNHRPAAMINLLGDLFLHPNASTVFRRPGFAAPVVHGLEAAVVNTYFYGKEEARPGRKMGHIIAVDDSVAAAVAAAQRQLEAFSRVS